MEITSELVIISYPVRFRELIEYLGPRELSITDPNALSYVLGFGAKTSKGPFYDSMEESVSTTTNKAFHKHRRHVWDSSMKLCESISICLIRLWCS